MKLYRILFIFFLLFATICVGQKEANIWYFGDKAGLDFNSGTPIVLNDSEMETYEGCATISDGTGNLLFYTDGRSVWNRNHQVMPNGSGLLGSNSATQSAIIVPKPNDTNIYYVFTVDDLAEADGLNYSEVNMSLNSGLGDVTANKNINLLTPTTEKITAVLHENGEDIWVITHGWQNNNFYAYLVTSTGVNTTPVVSSSGTIVDGLPFNSAGVIKVSPNGKRIVICNAESNAELFDFNSANGTFSNPILLNTRRGNFGAEFSPSGELLYVSNIYNGSKIDQYNLNAINIQASETKIYTATPFRTFGSLQLGPDNKIYVANYTHNYISIIHAPNALGLSCNYEHDAILLDPGSSYFGLPTFIQSYFFNTSIVYSNTCFEDATTFSLATTPDTVTWGFGDPTAGAGNTSTLLEPTHVFTSPGTYTVTATATLGTDTTIETEIITIYEVPTATPPANLFVCDTDNNGFHNFNLTTQTNSILNGQLLTEFEVAYFASMLDYTSDTKIPDDTNYQNTTAYQEQTIIARVRNKENLDCEAITAFKIQVFESPTPKLPTEIPNLSFCDNTSVGNDTDGKIIFNLTDRATLILNEQSTTDFLVSYFLDEDFTQQITNETNYPNLNPTQRIYTKVENKANSTCFAKTSFLLEVFKLPSINSPVSLKQCDNSDINGFSAFNLNEAKAKIVSSLEGDTITFFEEKTLAESNTSPIPNPTNYTNQVVSNDTVWARVENNNSCFRVSEVNLIVSTTKIPSNFLKTFYECDSGTNNTDGIATFNFSSVTDNIKELFPANQQLIIKYYRNEADGLSELNEITDISNYENFGYPNLQEVYVRVDSQLDNDCLGLGHHITLTVEKVPVANSVTIDPACDNDRDGLYSFDTATIQNTIIGIQTNVAVRYFDTNGVALSSPLPNPFSTASQTITARIVNTSSQDLDGPCFDETTIDFVVNSVPIAYTVASQEQCDNDTDGIIGFDTSSIESTVLGMQTGLIVTYFDENNVVLPSPLPNPFFTASQTIRVRLENPIYDVCYEETIVDFIVREKPTFDLIDEDIICMTNAPRLELEIENPNENNNTYTWTDENNTIISSLPTATVTKGGVYKVVATSIYDCTSEEQEITINESSISTINSNDIEVVDDSTNNSIRIDPSSLGLGVYEFRLLNEDLAIIRSYQDESFFDDLEGGIYTIEVNDKNGCGSITFEVSVLSFPKFFTPNRDGINDVWQINGISKNFYQSGTIKILNRYGNVLSTFTIDDMGWDGAFKGEMMPSNDYWFYIELLDNKNVSRSRSGNFSLLRR